MPAYIVAYDLRQPGRNYDPLYAAIKGYGTWGKVTESLWVIDSASSAVSIRDHLTGFIDKNDRIFVVKSGLEAAWRNAMAENEWLKSHL